MITEHVINTWWIFEQLLVMKESSNAIGFVGKHSTCIDPAFNFNMAYLKVKTWAQMTYTFSDKRNHAS